MMTDSSNHGYAEDPVFFGVIDEPHASRLCGQSSLACVGLLQEEMKR
jgi:hypothetical protein